MYKGYIKACIEAIGNRVGPNGTIRTIWIIRKIKVLLRAYQEAFRILIP